MLGNDFDGTSCNLGGNTKSLEEGRFTRFHSSVSSWDEDVVGGEGTGSGRCSDLVGEDEVSNVLQVTLGEDETNVALDMGKELLELRVVGQSTSKGTSDHGVLAHQYDGLSSESYTDLVELVGSYVRDLYQEDGGVVLHEREELVKVSLLDIPGNITSVHIQAIHFPLDLCPLCLSHFC